MLHAAVSQHNSNVSPQPKNHKDCLCAPTQQERIGCQATLPDNSITCLSLRESAVPVTLQVTVSQLTR